MSTTQGSPAAVLPLYLLIDLSAGPDPERWKATVNRFAHTLAAEAAAARVRLELCGMSEGLTMYGAWGTGGTGAPLPVLQPAGRASYAAALPQLGISMTDDLKGDDGYGPPLLLVLAESPPPDDAGWRTAIAGLHGDLPELRVEIVRHLDDPRQVLRALLEGRRAETGPAAEPAWKGQFTPYSVGDPGAAASKVRAVPDEAEWDRRDTVLDGVEIQDDRRRTLLHLRAASVRGLTHRYAGTVRQDEYAFRRTRNGRHLVVAVADGVSNSPQSHHAAALITRTGCKLVADQLDEQPPDRLDWTSVVELLSHEIVLFAGRRRPAGEAEGELDYRSVAQQMAATALFGVVDLQAVDGELAAHVFAVGDSSGWVLRGGRDWVPLHDVKNSGDGPASSTTRALPAVTRGEPPAIEVRLRPADVLVLMSDGVGDPLGDGRGPVGDFLAEAWRTPPPAVAFAGQVDFARRSHDDDRTAVALWVP